MKEELRLRSAAAMSSAFRVSPDVVEETAPEAEQQGDGKVGIYGWKTPRIDSFELPESDELIIALHLGGSRRVRAITDQGLSRSRSAPGLITVLPPGRTAAFRTEGSVSLMTLHVPCALAKTLSLPITATVEPAWQQPRFAFRDNYVSASLEVLLRAVQGGQRMRPDYVVKVVDAMLCHLAQSRQVAQSGLVLTPGASVLSLGQRTLADVYALIDARLGEDIRLDDLARLTGLSRAAFTRAFRQVTGLSAHQAVMNRRIEAARRLLAETDLDLSHIAQETGWSSQSHFTACFRKAVGCTPARYRSPH